jgi:hypothetical protein
MLGCLTGAVDRAAAILRAHSDLAGGLSGQRAEIGDRVAARSGFCRPASLRRGWYLRRALRRPRTPGNECDRGAYGHRKTGKKRAILHD